jgi:8-amino-7-oxononanoate synthase
MADIFDKCLRFLKESPIVKKQDRATAEGVLYQQLPLNNAGPWMDIDGRKVLQLSTNDYLGLANHPNLRKAATEIVSRYGVSAPMGARPLTGTIELHRELERQLAEFKRTEKALVFSNGAHAMMGAVAALAGPRDLVVLDRYAHASLVCGAKISGARMRFFRHNDLEDLEAILMETPPSRAKMIVVDGVYSMQGDIAPLGELCDLCEKHGARLVVDDAHGTGVCGKNGRGTAELLGVEDRIDLHLGTCSKALATSGGFAAGDATVIHYLQYCAPTILFTKAMPACVAAATLEALKLLRDGHDRRKALWNNVRLLQDGLRRAQYDIGQTQTPITPIRGNGSDAVHLGAALYERFNIWASAVLYPAVPIGTSILRVIPTANHTPDDVEVFLKAVAELKGAAREARNKQASSVS